MLNLNCREFAEMLASRIEALNADNLAAFLEGAKADGAYEGMKLGFALANDCIASIIAHIDADLTGDHGLEHAISMQALVEQKILKLEATKALVEPSKVLS